MKICIDTSAVSGTIDGICRFDENVWDSWRYKNLEFSSGKIYGLISEYHQGCMFLSYLLGGKIDFSELKISIDGSVIKKEDLANISWNLEPSKEKYKDRRVRKSIEKAIKKNNCKEEFDEIAKAFCLTEPRYDRKLIQLSGERWRASAALGYASGKRIFFAPYECSDFYHSLDGSNLFKILRYLADHDSIVVLPVGSDAFLKKVVDECIYLDRTYD